MGSCQRSACLPHLWVRIPHLSLALVLSLVAKCKSALVVAVGLLSSWMSSWVWLNAWLKGTEESAETCGWGKSRLVLITLGRSPIWTRLKRWRICSLTRWLSAVVTLLHGFQIGFGFYLGNLEREERYLSVSSHLCRRTLQGPEEPSERGNLKDKKLFYIPVFLKEVRPYPGMLKNCLPPLRMWSSEFRFGVNSAADLIYALDTTPVASKSAYPVFKLQAPSATVSLLCLHMACADKAQVYGVSSLLLWSCRQQ